MGMDLKGKMLQWGVLTGLVLALSAGPLEARTVWERGRVTRAPWIETHRFVEIDGVRYTFMSRDVNLERHYQGASGRWYREKISFENLRTGQEVWIRIQGHRIYELYVEP